MSTQPLERCASQIIEDYRSKTPKSQKLFARATRSLPGGVSGNLRYFHPYPLYMAEADGCRTTDVDGNHYIDCFLCNGPLLLGHRPPEVTAALEAARHMGSLLLNPSVLVECAERLCAMVPCAEKVRFLNSGTEALLTAVRYARGFTGREKIVKFFGHYHGQDDQFLVGAGPDRRPFGAGVPDAALARTVTIPFNGIEDAYRVLRADDVAAVVLDPAMHAGGLWGTTREYLEELRTLTRRHGAILIFDEVITGFRLAPGGAQKFYGVTPDLATFAKALGAGEKIAAVAGRADIMKVADPVECESAHRVFQSGTGNDGTFGLTAAIAAMDCYRALGHRGAYDTLSGLATHLAEGLHETFAEAGIPCHVNASASMLQLFLTARPADFTTYAGLDQRLLDLFFLALITRDVVLTLPTSNHIYLSFAHGQKEIDRIVAAARAVIAEYRFAEAFFETT